MLVLSCPNKCKEVKLYNTTDKIKSCVKHDTGEQEFIDFLPGVCEKRCLTNWVLFSTVTYYVEQKN